MSYAKVFPLDVKTVFSSELIFMTCSPMWNEKRSGWWEAYHEGSLRYSSSMLRCWKYSASTE